MKKQYKLIISILILVGLIFSFWLIKSKPSFNTGSLSQKEAELLPPLPTTYTKKIEVAKGATYGSLMKEAGVAATTTQTIFKAAESVYNLSTIGLGRNIELVYDIKTNKLKQLIYQINTEDKLYVSLITTTSTSSPQWEAKRLAIPYEVKIKTVSGTIESSLYESALAQGIDERAVVGFADVFEWSIDFAWDVQNGDSYKFIYEERYLDGKYIMPGRILAGKFINSGKPLYALYYETATNTPGYFNEKGESTQRMFLKAPVAFKYISSGFTTGSRYISAFNIATGHRAIDYAAISGTPIRAVGDGTVILAGWNGAYGIMVKVRHSSTYQTNYGHMSRVAVKRGQKVKQGQTIGYVGSTGLSTGPHLHYEMEKNGTKINPLREVFPNTQGVKKDDLDNFLTTTVEIRSQLDN